ncbi:MAG TPA: FAD-dependent tricarballylate dehydrogenase TcuA [Gaiellaceae bacterium]|jgi:tricarballylate dehydrogenase
MISNGEVHDVIVVGGGNAGLCAALTAREHVENILVLEKAPESKKGGNSFFTGGRMRVPHEGIEDLVETFDWDPSDLQVEIGPYPEEDFHDDLQRASRYQCDEGLARLIAGQARADVKWLTSMGAKFLRAIGADDVKTAGNKLKQIGHDDIRHYEGGQGLVENLTKQCLTRGIRVQYETTARRLVRGVDGVVALIIDTPEGPKELRARSFVLACGGFEASTSLRTTYLGPGWDLAKVRGSEFNTGDGLVMALEIGARAHGHWSGCHSVAVDFFAAEYGDRVRGDVSERVSYHYGITVDRHAKRYFDEGTDIRAFTYAVSGRNLIEKADGFAVQIFDAKTIDLLRATYRTANVTKAESDDLRVIAAEMNLDPDTLVETIKEYNAGVPESGPVDYSILDGRGTKGIAPKKSNWAQRIDTPPYTAFPVGPGITFTFGGLRVNPQGEVIDQGGAPIPGLYAAGEMVGGIYYHNYPGGSGLTSGLVMGRAAGRSAGQRAKSLSVTAEVAESVA